MVPLADVFFGLSPAFAGIAAEIEGFQITWEDVGQALGRALET